MKKEYLIAIGIVCILLGFGIGKITNDTDVIITEKETPVNQGTKPTSELTNTGLPRDDKATPYENYTNAEVRTAINFTRHYLNEPELLNEDYPKIYALWWDYRLRVCNDATVNDLMQYYNYWITSYPYGI